MEVKTKFNPGDTAWIFEDSSLTEVEITHVVVRKDKVHTRIYNHFRENSFLSDEDIYKSKDEFFQKNFKKECNTEAKKEAIAFANWLSYHGNPQNCPIEKLWDIFQEECAIDDDLEKMFEKDVENISQIRKQIES